jgi:hypothetical protein
MFRFAWGAQSNVSTYFASLMVLWLVIVRRAESSMEPEQSGEMRGNLGVAIRPGNPLLGLSSASSTEHGGLRGYASLWQL